MTKDMTEGSPLRLLINFSIPLLLGSVFQQLYNLVDTIIVGRYLGINALSAVGSTGSITYLVTGFCTGICSGFAIPVAQQFGAKKYDEMRKYIMNGTYLSVGFALVITLVTVFICRNILVWTKTPNEIIDQSYAYLVVIFAGIPFTFLYNMTSGIIRALGDSKRPFYFLLAATVLNVILDLFFILALGMGVEGAAYATVISQAFSGICCLWYMRKNYEELKVQAEERKVDVACAKALCAMGLPLGLLSCITGIGTVMLQSAVNSLGMAYVAAYTAVTKLKQFTINPYMSMDTAVATYTSQNYGAGKLNRVYDGVKAGLLIYGAISVVMIILLVFAGDKVALIFVDSSEVDVLKNVDLFFNCCGPFYAVICILNCFRSVIQGLGYSSASMAAGVCELAARAVMALAVIPAVGYIGVCFTDAAAWCVAAVCVVVMYIVIMKRIRSIGEK